MAKILERVVAFHLRNHLAINNLFDPLQSGFRKFHSTETALVRVTNDLLMASDSGAIFILILLDLRAAFNTVDHSLLLARLEQDFGVSGTALKWFKSYFTDRSQFVSMGGFRSEISPVFTGVPQGSVLGPLLFNIYLAPLGQLLRSLGLHYHFYADDTQIYIHSKSGEHLDVDFLSGCVSEIKEWMSTNFLCLNSGKTEVMLIGSRHQISKAGSLSLTIDGSVLATQAKVRNLGVIFDTRLSFDSFVQSTVKSSFFHLRNIARLRPMLNFSVAEKLMNSFVISRIDYCNALLAGVSKSTLNKLQYVQNSAARILTGSRVCNHITPVLESLHWLPVRFRVDFKIMMLTYKALHSLAPYYLSELLTSYTPTRRLRSSQSNLLVVPQTRLRSMGDRAFSSYAPVLWNSLPPDLRDTQGYDIFKGRLKTYFFKLAFDC
uniref:Reverse transcriptase domain-containing protein n=1 Tax=Cyprinus carpio TaxID=7962 RepID=A0A8C1MC95_CYPCA